MPGTELPALGVFCENLPVPANLHSFGNFINPLLWRSELHASSFIPMSSSQLPNYLRAERKRLALSQKDVAVLLGADSGAKACRYERFVREPTLRTALAYAAIFHKPVTELFAGLYQTMEAEVAARAKVLASKAESQKPTRQMLRRRASLTNIARSITRHPLHRS